MGGRGGDATSRFFLQSRRGADWCPRKPAHYLGWEFPPLNSRRFQTQQSRAQFKLLTQVPALSVRI